MRDEIVHKPITAKLSIGAKPRVSPTQSGERWKEEGTQRESTEAFLEMLHQKWSNGPHSHSHSSGLRPGCKPELCLCPGLGKAPGCTPQGYSWKDLGGHAQETSQMARQEHPLSHEKTLSVTHNSLSLSPVGCINTHSR